MQTMKSAKEKLANKAYDAHMDDNKYAARNLAGRALSMQAGMNRRARQVAKEEVENLDELSKSTLSSYISKAKQDRSDQSVSKNSGDKEQAAYAKKQVVKRTFGIVDAKSRLNKEEFSFNDYLVAAIHIVGEDYAVELANYAYNLQDTSIFENLETEAFNASNVNATHAADVKAHHTAELKKKADAGDENAKKRMELIKKSREAKTAEFNSRMDSM